MGNRIKVNHTELYYIKSGKGQPLILLHGNGETSGIYDKAIPILSQYYTVYALDSRGHGGSRKASVYHYEDLAEDVYAFIQKLDLKKPVIYGFSDGGIIGLLLAARFPDLLSNLIVSGANTSPDGLRNGWRKLFEVIYKFVKDPKMKMMLQEPDITAELLNQITIPVLVLAGSRDMVKRSDTDFIAENIPDSKLHIITGSGHGSYIVHNPRIAHIILEELGN